MGTGHAVEKGRLLVVERHFPYSGGARTETFVETWAGLGWTLDVLTRDPPSSPFPLELLQPGIPESVSVTRVAVPPVGTGGGLLPPRIRRGLYRLVHLPLPDAEWVDPALKAAADAGSDVPDIVYSSSPSEAAHQIAMRLAERWDRPWVMDVRDLFTQYAGRFGAITPLHTLWARRLEGAWYRRADRVIVNTPRHLEKLRERFELPEGKTLVIPNGFRDDDARHAGAPRPPGPVSSDRPLQIGYLGVLGKHANGWEVVVDGICRAIGEGLTVRLRIWGHPEPEVSARFAQGGAPDAVRFMPLRPHPQAMAELADCDVLLVATAATHAHLVPQKLYNYLALRRHVLTVAPVDSMPADIVTATGSGSVVEPEPRAVAGALLGLAAALGTGGLDPHPSDEALRPYRRRDHAARISALFEELRGRDG